MSELDIDALRARVGTFDAPTSNAEQAGELAPTLGLFDDDPAERAVLAACHTVLAAKQVTEHELRTKLRAGGHDGQLVERALERCRQAGLLDDARYARAFVESRVRRGHGASRIRQDLVRRGIARATIEQALVPALEAGALDEAAHEAARRKCARMDLEDRAVRAKAMRWLLGRGYSSAQADSALRRLRQERADGES